MRGSADQRAVPGVPSHRRVHLCRHPRQRACHSTLRRYPPRRGSTVESCWWCECFLDADGLKRHFPSGDPILLWCHRYELGAFPAAVPSCWGASDMDRISVPYAASVHGVSKKGTNASSLVENCVHVYADAFVCICAYTCRLLCRWFSVRSEICYVCCQPISSNPGKSRKI